MTSTQPPLEIPLDLTLRTRSAVIVTALPLEIRAATEHLQLVQDDRFEGDVYERGIFLTPKVTWRVTVAEAGAGNVNAALHTDRLIRHSKAEIAIFLGVAGGLKDVALGDVVVARKIYGYEAAADRDELLPRPEVGLSSHKLLQEAMSLVRRDSWHRRVKLANKAKNSPRAFVGAIAAGEKVLKSQSSPIREFLARNYGDALAVEMEGFGFLQAAHQSCTKTDCIVIRGISDLLGDKAECDAEGWQPSAARNAAAFVFELLFCLGTQQESTPIGRSFEFEVAIRVPPERLSEVLARLREILGDDFPRDGFQVRDPHA